MRPALGYYQRQPSTRRRRAEIALLARLSLACHGAIHLGRTQQLAPALRALADEWEALGPSLAAELETSPTGEVLPTREVAPLFRRHLRQVAP